MEERESFSSKFGNILDKVSRIFSQITVLVMVVTVIFTVFMRYFLKSPLVWGDELAKYSLVFMTFIGASVGLRDKQLASMEILTDKLPTATKRMVSIIVVILELVLLGFLFYYSLALLSENSVQVQKSPALNVPMSWVYFSMPLGLGLMIIQAILILVEEIKGKNIAQGGRGK